jgi:hypothetical protein
MHGWWWPGRQTVVVLPCAVLAVACWAASSRFAFRAVVGLGVVGVTCFAWLVAQAIVGDMTLVVTFEHAMNNPVTRAWRALLPDYRELTARDWTLHVLWLGLVVAMVAAALWPRLASARDRFVRAPLRGASLKETM